eukprot:gnl/Spiro4/22963_TR11339_c0_g1_i1.p1 gnl/Spiro4/22963_TR11339_c0_g1~~gnl/Spiro4/22963_TR11339_c0_g1_i1.p1  ORF type:complete len:373 (+),score=58.97 gnl/Spiro4/22963_TR11339_c0_g1_i1:66-1184(+)
MRFFFCHFFLILALCCVLSATLELKAPSTCATGLSQSPIAVDRAGAVNDQLLSPLNFDYQPGSLFVGVTGADPSCLVWQLHQNTGHKPPSIIWDGVPYELMSVRVSHPAEHVIAKNVAPCELQLWHSGINEVGFRRVLALAVPCAVASAADNLSPSVSDLLALPAGKQASIDVSLLLPNSTALDYVAYNGSTTTEPCTEHVQWVVLADAAVLVSDALLQSLANHFPASARPTQPLNNRTLAMYFDEPTRKGCTHPVFSCQKEWQVCADDQCTAEVAPPITAHSHPCGVVTVQLNAACGVHDRYLAEFPECAELDWGDSVKTLDIARCVATAQCNHVYGSCCGQRMRHGDFGAGVMSIASRPTCSAPSCLRGC